MCSQPLETERKEEVYLRVKKIIQKALSIEEGKISMESHYINDLGLDSLDRIELLMEFEDEFQREIPERLAEKLATVGATVDYIVAEMGKHDQSI